MILHLAPFEFYYHNVAAKSGSLYCATDQWHMSETGHTKVLNDFVTVERIDYMIARYEFTRIFVFRISIKEVL